MKNHRKSTERSSAKGKNKNMSRRLMDYALLENPHLSLQIAARVWRSGSVVAHGHYMEDL